MIAAGVVLLLLVLTAAFVFRAGRPDRERRRRFREQLRRLLDRDEGWSLVNDSLFYDPLVKTIQIQDWMWMDGILYDKSGSVLLRCWLDRRMRARARHIAARLRAADQPASDEALTRVEKALRR